MAQFDNTIKAVMNLTWPMIVISVLLLSSIRIMDIVKNKKPFVFYKETLTLIFIIYVFCLFQVVTFEDTSSFSSNNLIPFKEILRYHIGSRLFIKNVIGNFVLFIPYGIFVSIYAKLDKSYYAFFLILFASLTIEVTQGVIGRVFDVDDIILNVCGGMFGYFLYYVIDKISLKLPKFFRSTASFNIITFMLLFGLIYYIWRIVV